MVKAAGREHEPMRLDAGKLGRLEFFWTGDRYHHTWSPADAPAPALKSIESDANAVWPVSPPLQQVHLQSFDDGREVIFGVGMSGRGHWSASFTMVPDLSCWIVEFACRSPLIPEHLGNHYSLHGPWELEQGSWKLNLNGVTACLEAIAPSTLTPLATDFPTGHPTPAQALEPDAAWRLALTPGMLPENTPSTTQWAYRLKLA
jgi:hypothetical protein